MASFSKYNSFTVGRIFLHNNRMSEDGVQHSNEDINPEKTIYNYHIKKGTISDVQKRLSELFVLKKSTTTVLGEMVVTLPKDVKATDKRDFFQAVYDFYANDFGEENIVNAVVHKDETRPHIHLDFIPVLQGEPKFTTPRGQKAIEDWKEAHDGNPPTERICCKDLITRKYLSTMHQRLSNYVKNYIGYEVEILNGATENGNRTVLQLKVDSLKKEIDQMGKQQEHLYKEISTILTSAKQHGIETNDIGCYPLIQKIEDLENQNTVLKSIITRQGYSWKKEDLEAIQEKKYIAAKSVRVNIYDGSLVNTEIEENAVVVIELPDQKSRNSPQKKMIDADIDLERQSKFVQSSTKQVMCRQSRTSDRIYLFIKTDGVKQTIENLLLMEQQLCELDLKNRKVYMERMGTDIYDLARSILTKNEIESLYFTNRSILEKNKGTELTINNEK